MENAAKALLISAGVLIAILVMSLFSYIVTQMSEDTASIAEIAQKSKISKFNQQFLNFDDKHNLTIQDVATIVNLALDNNESKIIGAVAFSCSKMIKSFVKSFD